MSLIQAALSKTHNQEKVVPAATAPASATVKSIDRLQTWDQQVEANLASVQEGNKKVKVDADRLVISGFVKVAALLACLLVVGFYFWIRSVEKDLSVPKSASAAAVSSVQLSRSEPQPQMEVSIPSRTDKYAQDYKLNGIVWDIDTPMALINSQIVKVGDKVGKKAVVKEVGRDYAVLERGNETVFVQLSV